MDGRFIFIIAPARDDHILGGQKFPADLKPVRRAIDAALPLRPAWARDIKAVTVARGRKKLQPRHRIK